MCSSTIASTAVLCSSPKTENAFCPSQPEERAAALAAIKAKA